MVWVVVVVDLFGRVSLGGEWVTGVGLRLCLVCVSSFVHRSCWWCHVVSVSAFPKLVGCCERTT